MSSISLNKKNMEIFIEEVNNGKSEVISVSLNSILTCNDLEGKYKEIVSEFYSHLIDEKLLSSLNNKIEYFCELVCNSIVY